jgi:hypothetical protein
MTEADAIRFLVYEAGECRDRDAHEALCLLLPALARVFGLPTMGPREALAFRLQLKEALGGAGNHSKSRVTPQDTQPAPSNLFPGDFRHDPNPSTVGSRA